MFKIYFILFLFFFATIGLYLFLNHQMVNAQAPSCDLTQLPVGIEKDAEDEYIHEIWQEFFDFKAINYSKSFVLGCFDESGTGNLVYTWISADEITFTENSEGDRNLVATGGVGTTSLTMRDTPFDPSHSLYERGTAGSPSGQSSPYTRRINHGDPLGRLVGVVWANEVTYSPSWEGGIYNDGMPDQPEQDGDQGSFLNIITQDFDNCSSLNLFCHIRNAFVGLRNLLIWAFIPSTEQIGETFDGLGVFMTEKLGFLAFPFSYMNDFRQALQENLNIGMGCLVTLPAGFFGTEHERGLLCTHGYHTSASTSGFFDHLEPIRVFARFAITFGLLALLYNKYREVLAR